MTKAAATRIVRGSRFGAWLGAVALTAGTLSVGIVLGPAGPAAADPIGDCSTTVGEIVVVDFAHWGGPIDRGCAASLSTGYNALSEAGFITEGTEEDGPDLICRIGLASQGSSSYEPTPSEDPCVNTPPASAYWSYWHADAGQNTWTYARQGSMEYRPPPGSVDAWVYGATNIAGTTGQPPFSPSSVRATNPSPSAAPVTTSPAPTAPPSPTPVKTGAPPATAHPAPPAPAPTSAGSRSGPVPHPTRPPPSASVGHPAGSAAGASSSSASTTTTVARPPASHAVKGGRPKASAASTTRPTTKVSWIGLKEPRIVTLGPLAAGRHPSSTGSPWWFVAGAAVVLLLLGTGGMVAWRRRQGGEP